MKRISTGILVGVMTFSFGGCLQTQDKTGASLNLGKSLDTLVQDGFENLSEVKSSSFSMAMKGDTLSKSGDAETKTTFNMDISGDTVFQNGGEDPRFMMKVDLSVDESGQDPIKANAEVRMDKDVLYMNVAELASERVPQDMLSRFVGKWYKMVLPADLIDEGMKKDSPELTEEEQKVKELMQNTRFFSDVTYEGMEEIKGVESYKLKAKLDKDALREFIVESRKVYGNELENEDRVDLDRGLQQLVNFEGLVWITKKDEIVTQLEGNVVFDDATVGKADVEMKMSLWDFNKDVVIEAPDNFEMFDPMLLLGGMPMGM